MIAAIILAAGASTRMGTPKQLLLYKGRSLLQGVIETAIAAECDPVIVVLGAFGDRIRNQVEHIIKDSSGKNSSVQWVINFEWETGMGSSIRRGVQALGNFTNTTQPAPLSVSISTGEFSPVKAAILLLCDQPFVSEQTIHQLKTAYYATGKPIIASAYASTLGVPALFDAVLFPELLNLSSMEGAKQVIQRHAGSVGAIAFDEGVLDIDTPRDYQKLQGS